MSTLAETLGEVMTPVMTGKRVFCALASLSEQGQRLAGIPSEIMYTDVDVNTEIGLLVGEYYKTYPTFSWDLYNFEARALGQPVAVSKFGLPDIDYNKPIIHGEEDLGKLKWPTENPLDAGRYPLLLKQFDLAEKYFGSKVALFNYSASSFTLACELMGFPQFMALVKRQPDLAHEIMRRIVDDIHTPLVQAVAERFPGIPIKFSDAWEMIPNISPKVQKEYAWKYYDRLRDNTKDMNTGGLSWWSSYGEGSMPDPEAYLKEKIAYSGGIAVTNTEDCPWETYRKVAVETGAPFNFMIPALTVLDGPEDTIIEYMRKAAKELRPTIANFSWNVICPASAKQSHIKAAQAAADAFGVLPCPAPEDFDSIEVEVPEFEESFESFCRKKAKENPEGYTFKWLDDAKFIEL